MKELNVSEHSTPYTSLPTEEGKVVRLVKVKQRKGYYHMEGVKGYELYRVLKPIQVTNLQVKQPDGKWQTLMIDDPMHWLGMQELARLANPGSALVAGLGLGLILHHLVKRTDIASIKIIEIDPEIISFIAPYIPKDKRIEIVNDNFFGFCTNNKEHFDTTIIDLWVISQKSPDSHRAWVKDCMSAANTLAKVFSDKVLIWGIRGYQISNRRKKQNELEIPSG